MPIPVFDAYGGLRIPDPPPATASDEPAQPGHVAYLQLSLVRVTLPELYETFVVGRPDEAHRMALWGKWMLLRRDLSQMEIPYITWLGGSYFTQKVHPGDIDLCLFFDASDIGLLDASAFDQFDGIINHPDPKGHYGCDLYHLMNYPLSHPRFYLSCLGYSYWTRVYGVDRWGKQRTILYLAEGGIYG
jgi:hypothetical protein